MKIYFIKYDEPYSKTDSYVFKKGCVEINNKFLPVILNYGDIIGKTKIYSDEVGCYIKQPKHNKLAIVLGKILDVNFSFLLEDEEIKDGVRYATKIKICELFITGASAI